MVRKTKNIEPVLPLKFQSEFLAKFELCICMGVEYSLLDVHKYNRTHYLKEQFSKLIFIT